MSNPTSRQVQLRKDLQQSRQQQQGKAYLVVKDPIARRYFRFTETQATILEFLAEPNDAESVALKVSERLGGNVSAATIAAFFDSLESRDLLDTPAVRERLGTSPGGNPDQRSSILYKQVASFNPERIFDWLLPRTRWAFTPAFHVLGCFLILSGVTIFFLHWNALRAATPNLLNIWTILMVWPIVFSVSAYHEFSHGLTCRHFGGQVKEVGFMLIYFSPAFYCDVSDAWMFPERRQRMLVTFAGGYSQLMLWGLCAIIWRITEPSTIINHVMVIVVIFSGLQTLFNFNPLIKLDGYYMLSDYLEVPNLRSKAFASLWNWITKNSSRKTFREERSQLIYGVCAVIFSSTLLITVYSRIYTWATHNWQTAGLVGFAVFSTVTLRRTATESMSGLKTLGSFVATKWIRNSLIFLTALMVSIFVPWELKIPADLKILGKQEVPVYAQTAGTLTEIPVREGMQVHKGDLLARTQDFDKQNEVEKITGELLQQRRTLERLKAGPREVEIRQLETRIEAKKAEIEGARQNEQGRRELQEKAFELKRQLEGLKNIAEAQQRLHDKGLTSELVYKDAQNSVAVQEQRIVVAEAQVSAFDENANNQIARLTKELAALQADLDRLNAGNSPEQIRETQAAIDRSAMLIASMNNEIAKSEIRSRIDGKVATRFVETMVGRRLAVGEEFIRLVDTAGLTAELSIPERELEDVKLGDVVWMRIRGVDGDYFEGRVDTIGTIAQVVNGESVIPVMSQLTSNNEVLRPGMTGKAQIYAGKQPIIKIATRRIRKWIKTEFLPLWF